MSRARSGRFRDTIPPIPSHLVSTAGASAPAVVASSGVAVYFGHRMESQPPLGAARVGGCAPAYSHGPTLSTGAGFPPDPAASESLGSGRPICLPIWAVLWRAGLPVRLKQRRDGPNLANGRQWGTPIAVGRARRPQGKPGGGRAGRTPQRQRWRRRERPESFRSLSSPPRGRSRNASIGERCWSGGLAFFVLLS